MGRHRRRRDDHCPTELDEGRGGQRDLSMHQTKKGTQCYFGMKAQIGMDEGSGLVHHVACTAPNVGDVTQVHKLLHGRERTVCGDSDCTGADRRAELRGPKAGVLIAEKSTTLRATKTTREHGHALRWERHNASVRARVGHPFRVVKRSLAKSRYAIEAWQIIPRRC